MLEAPEVALKIEGLPSEGRPAAFDGAIGSFSLRAKTEPRGRVGEPLTLQLDVIGEGELASAIPRAQSDDRWRVYDPQRVESDDSEHVARFEQLIVPLAAGVTSLPSITLPHFDPTTGTYEVAEAGGTVDVAEAIDAVAPTEAPTMPEMRPDRTRGSASVRSLTTPRGWQGGLLAWLLLVPVGLLIARRRSRSRAERERRREREARVRQALSAMREASRRGDVSGLLEHGRTALAEKLAPEGTRPESLTLSDLDPHTVPFESVARIFDLADRAHFGVPPHVADLTTLADEVEASVDAISTPPSSRNER